MKKANKFKRRFDDKFKNPAFTILKELLEHSEIKVGNDSVTIKFNNKW